MEYKQLETPAKSPQSQKNFPVIVPQKKLFSMEYRV